MQPRTCTMGPSLAAAIDLAATLRASAVLEQRDRGAPVRALHHCDQAIIATDRRRRLDHVDVLGYEEARLRVRRIRAKRELTPVTRARAEEAGVDRALRELRRAE